MTTTGHDRIEAEATRIRAEYHRRARDLPDDFYSPIHPANLFLRHSQERAVRWALAQAGLLPLSGRAALEIGCGTGRWLRFFAELGATQGGEDGQLAGIDLDEDRVAVAARSLPHGDLRTGDATTLPWPDDSFDLVFQSTVFTSVLDASVRRTLADEMRRVVRPGGAIVWYDFRVDNPRNPNVRGVRRAALRGLFPGAEVQIRRTTLAPPLARRLAPRAWWLAWLLESLRVLNTHDVAVVSWR